jgi:hypothetical protein
MRRQDGGIEIAVHDYDSQLPEPRDAPEYAEDGRGLAILELMTNGLCVEPYGATGKVVRCQLDWKCTN